MMQKYGLFLLAQHFHLDFGLKTMYLRKSLIKNN